ncbi:MAG: GIY-YIG nuclease family protein [Terriglobales bacterium]
MSRVSGKPYFVYILWSQSGRCFYIGISEDPARRVEQHNEGKRGWTARHRPWQLVHQEQHPGYREARGQRRPVMCGTVSGVSPFDDSDVVGE